jgi:hypothetical protein
MFSFPGYKKLFERTMESDKNYTLPLAFQAECTAQLSLPKPPMPRPQSAFIQKATS